MTDKELRKLNRRELLQMLIIQCEETERLQQERERLTDRLETLEESYTRLIGKLNVKDEKLNQKDAKIAELKYTIKEMKEAKRIDLEQAGSVAETVLRLDGIFKAAQEAMDCYLENMVSLSGAGQAALKEIKDSATLEASDKAETAEEVKSALPVTIVPIHKGKKASENRRVESIRKKQLHG